MVVKVIVVKAHLVSPILIPITGKDQEVGSISDCILMPIKYLISILILPVTRHLVMDQIDSFGDTLALIVDRVSMEGVIHSQATTILTQDTCL